MYYFCIDRNKNLIRLKFYNQVFIEDVVTAFKNLIEDPTYHPYYNIAVDFRGCALQKVESPVIDSISTQRSKIKNLRVETLSDQQGRTAIVADLPIITAIAYLYKGEISDFREVEVFSAMESALEWLQSDCAYILGCKRLVKHSVFYPGSEDF